MIIDLIAEARFLRRTLSDEQRHTLVVRSEPFGDIIDDVTRQVRIKMPAQMSPNEWRIWAYALCQQVKRRR